MSNSDDTDLANLQDLTEFVTNTGRDDLNLHLKVTREMGELAAGAAKEIERYRSAVPARQHTVRHLITAGVVAGGFWVICTHPAVAWQVAALVAVLGGVSIAEQIVKKIKGDKG